MGRAGDGGDGGEGGKAAGSGGSGSDPSTLPNLSTAGRSGSGGGAGTSAECELLRLGDCVKEAIGEAVACLSADRSGTFNEDRTRCTSPEADGEIEFAAPARAGSKGYRLDFDLKVAGESCVRFAVRDEPAGSAYVEKYELVTRGHTVNYWHGFERKLECDGQAHEYDATVLRDCPASSPLYLPMPIVTPTSSSLDFEFPIAGGRSKVFTCADP